MAEVLNHETAVAGAPELPALPDERLKVLLIEDNPLDARLIQIMLAEAGEGLFRLDCAGPLFARPARLEQGGIDMVLLDLSLPDSHGLDTFSKVHSRFPDVPIIVMSGLADETVAV